MESLLPKLFLAPLLVVMSTLAGRRWGPDVTGILVAFPIVAGPILFITYQQHGAKFASDAASSSLLGLVSLATFAVLFARTARRFGWLTTLAASWAAVLAMDAALSVIQVAMLVALALTLVATAAAMALMPTIESERSGESERRAWPVWELPARATATGVLVLVVTTASSAMGPHWTGLLAPFPIATSVVAAFVHAQYGPAVTARTLSGAVMGLFSFAAFCVSVAVLLRPIGGAAFVLGAAVAVAVQLVAAHARGRLRMRSSNE
ncbi:hypothetical protein [Rugosimonospora africana]|uniref:Uncharacterized protein n=1 Tax=Rugosimonospora africana TaxID=556532 RepID=A0A8J3VUB4_9ACTN|nr:hypothetical protein [Rugosimonospora africana]GIH19332.1 hypothetical protein Raf01_75040 [Rugosimonospora africana]